MVKPRIQLLPRSRSFALGDQAVELAAEAGLVLDEWEAHVLRSTLRQSRGMWAAPDVAVVVPRQNGKGAILEARELAGMFLLAEPLTIHSAHQFDTSMEAFRRFEGLILDTPKLHRQIKVNRRGQASISHSHGQEGLELKNGARISFRTRTKGGGRGFSCNCLILDEAMFLPEATFGALHFTISAQSMKPPGPQIWLTGSAVNQLVHDHGTVLARARERALRKDKGLAYFEWSLPQDNPDLVRRRNRSGSEGLADG